MAKRLAPDLCAETTHGLVRLRQALVSCDDNGMAIMIDMRVAELLTARLCHDLAGPIAAIGNGAELLDDEDPDFVRQAATLIGDSAGTAAKRLQFFRFIYGFSAGAIAGPPPHALASEYFANGAVACDYSEAARQLEPTRQRLGCNLLLVAGEALPRGGKITLMAEAGAVAVAATGDGAGPSAEISAALALTTPIEALTSRTVGAYFAGLLAQTLGSRLRIATEPASFRILGETSGP
jgi:histidine phosphotransferase ChpT